MTEAGCGSGDLTLFCCLLTAPSTSLPWLPLCPTGSDQWKVAERKLFNKGIAIYKKDFFLVQQLVSWGCFRGKRQPEAGCVIWGSLCRWWTCSLSEKQSG